MKRTIFAWLSILAFVVVLGIPQVMNAQMMGNPGMGQSDDAQAIHQLFVEHKQVRRTVTEIPDGIRALTESDNPQVAALIQSHVSKMYDRLSQKQFIPMMGMSSTLPTLTQSANQYQRQIRMTSKGIEVTETSTKPEMVAVIREHAREVTQFVDRGMPAMMNGRRR